MFRCRLTHSFYRDFIVLVLVQLLFFGAKNVCHAETVEECLNKCITKYNAKIAALQETYDNATAACLESAYAALTICNNNHNAALEICYDNWNTTCDNCAAVALAALTAAVAGYTIAIIGCAENVICQEEAYQRFLILEAAIYAALVACLAAANNTYNNCVTTADTNHRNCVDNVNATLTACMNSALTAFNNGKTAAQNALQSCTNACLPPSS